MRILISAQVAILGGIVLAAQNPVEFDVASIKANTSGQLPVGPPPNGPGRTVDRAVPALVLVRRAYPGATVTGLPNWAESERYDVEVHFATAATAEQQAQMWRKLLSDRMKLEAHYEVRQRPAYRLVRSRSDGQLGPQLKVSTLKCEPPDPAKRVDIPVEVRDAMMATIRDRRRATPQEEALLQSQCRGMINAWQTLYAGAADMKTLILGLNFLARPDRPVVDATGLDGVFAIKLWAAPPSVGAPDPDAPPSLFSALPDQLGLKLESATIEDQVLVVDHIERPSGN